MGASMASKCPSFVYTLCRHHLTRKRAWPLAISGFLFSCLHIYGHLPEFETWRDRFSRNHATHLIRFSDVDGDWVVDVAHSFKRSAGVTVDIRHLSTSDNVVLSSKLPNASKFLQHKRNNTYPFENVLKRHDSSVSSTTHNNDRGSRKIGQEFVRPKENKHENSRLGYVRSTNIQPVRKARGGREVRSKNVGVFRKTRTQLQQ